MKQPTYDELVQALAYLAEQANEDCPPEYRTEHFRTALDHAHDLIEAAQ